MLKYTRMATTLGQSVQTENGYLLGHYLSPRQQKLAGQMGRFELTSDRASAGFVHLVYGISHRLSTQVELQITERLNAMVSRLNLEDQSTIDASVDTLARLVALIASEDERAWCAAYMLRNQELVAVTHGDAVAYLYRNDTFYPLVSDQMNWPSKDAFGRHVKDYTVYIAGTQNKQKFSNIVSLMTDDCILIGAERLLVDIGQRNLLHIFDDSEDQEEAVGTILDRLQNSWPDNKQLLISFVENVYQIQEQGKGKKRTRDASELVSIAEATMTDWRPQSNHRNIVPYIDGRTEETKVDVQPELPIYDDQEDENNVAYEPVDDTTSTLNTETNATIEASGSESPNESGYRRPDSEILADSDTSETSLATQQTDMITVPDRQVPAESELSQNVDITPSEENIPTESRHSIPPEKADHDLTTSTLAAPKAPEPESKTPTIQAHQRLADRVEKDKLSSVDGSDVLAPPRSPEEKLEDDSIHEEPSPKWPYVVVVILILVIIYLVLNLIDRIGIADIPFLQSNGWNQLSALKEWVAL